MKTQLLLLLCAVSMAAATWTYSQSTGQMSHNGVLVGTGYSGNGADLNNPAKQCVIMHGPIPKGTYTIGPAGTHGHLGPISMELIPSSGNDMCGRSAFFIHGDNSKMDHSASDGCIVLNAAIRQKIADSGDHVLHVVG